MSRQNLSGHLGESLIEFLNRTIARRSAKPLWELIQTGMECSNRCRNSFGDAVFLELIFERQFDVEGFTAIKLLGGSGQLFRGAGVQAE